MTKPAITRLTGLEVDFNGTNNDNGVYVPQLTAAEIAANAPVQAGGIIFNTTTTAFNASTDGTTWAAFGGGGGDVTGPGGSVAGNLATFGDGTGQLLAASTMSITSDPAIYMPSTGGVPVGAITANDGELYVNNAKLAFRSSNANFTGAVGTFSTNTATPGAATIGTATLVGGTLLVNTSAVTAQSHIFLTNANNVNTGIPYIAAMVAGTSFTITSTVGGDTGDVNWMIINAA